MARDPQAQHPAMKGRKSALVGVAVNLILAACKLAGGIIGHSYALVADAIESMADVFSSLIVWGGLRIASTPRDAGHPYGHGKAEPLAAMAVALFLLGAAGLIGFQSISELRLGHHVSPRPFTLAVLVGVIVTKEVLFRYVVTIGTHIESTAVKTDAWHHRSDAITSAAALVGISVTVIGGPAYAAADDWAALVAASIIAFNGYRLFLPALHEVMDAAPAAALEAEIRRIAASVPGVVGLEKCFVRKMGFEYYVDIHVEVDGSLTVRQGHDIAHDVKAAIRKSNPRVVDVLAHIEPEGVKHE